MPWYSAQASLDALLVGRHIGLMHLVCYLRDGDRVFETYWTTRRGVEAMDYSFALMDLTVYGRQEPWEDSPSGWPQAMARLQHADQRTPHRPVVATRSRPLRRPHRGDGAMNADAPARPTWRAALTNGVFVVHYLQMITAMGIGMVVLGPLSMRIFHHAEAEVHVLLMATTMVVGMAVWMVYRRHAWPGIVEMAPRCMRRSPWHSRSTGSVPPPRQG